MHKVIQHSKSNVVHFVVTVLFSMATVDFVDIQNAINFCGTWLSSCLMSSNLEHWGFLAVFLTVFSQCNPCASSAVVLKPEIAHMISSITVNRLDFSINIYYNLFASHCGPLFGIRRQLCVEALVLPTRFVVVSVGVDCWAIKHWITAYCIAKSCESWLIDLFDL